MLADSIEFTCHAPNWPYSSDFRHLESQELAAHLTKTVGYKGGPEGIDSKAIEQFIESLIESLINAIADLFLDLVDAQLFLQLLRTKILQ